MGEGVGCEPDGCRKKGVGVRLATTLYLVCCKSLILLELAFRSCQSVSYFEHISK